MSLEIADFLDLARQVLTAGHILRFRPQGGSMWPQIRPGDILTVQACQPGDLRLGDLILFRSLPGKALVHRLIKFDAACDPIHYQARGDALVYPDPGVPADQILGRVTAYERNNRLHSLDTPLERLSAWLWTWGQPVLRPGFHYFAALIQIIKRFSSRVFFSR